MTTIYITYETAFDNYKMMSASFKSQVSSTKIKFNRIKDKYASDGELCPKDKKYLVDRMTELLAFNSKNRDSFRLISLAYPSLENKLAIFMNWIYTSQRVGYTLDTLVDNFNEPFLSMCVQRYNLIVNLLKVIRNTSVSKEDFTSVWDNENSNGVYRINEIITELLGETFNLMTYILSDDDPYDSQDGYYLADRDRCYTMLKARYPQYFDDVLAIHRATTGSYDELIKDSIIKYVITTIGREHGITPSLDGVVTNIEEYIDNYINDTFICDIGLKAV
jgi:hypothetical protein